MAENEPISLSHGDNHDDENWGARFLEIKKESGLENIFVCHVRVSDLSKIANELSMAVIDKSWMMSLDVGTKRAYERTVADTAEALVTIFKNNELVEERISSEFGEIMVSMGSARALEVIFSHIAIPIAELWKPKLKGNEGFDFHTVCPGQFINFGEAKFSNVDNPYGGNSGDSSGAGGQADGFIEKEKHYRDRPHLINLVSEQAITNLDTESFGIILAFSMNAKNELNVFMNAIKAAQSYQHLKKAKYVYIVGVSHAAPQD